MGRIRLSFIGTDPHETAWRLKGKSYRLRERGSTSRPPAQAPPLRDSACAAEVA